MEDRHVARKVHAKDVHAHGEDHPRPEVAREGVVEVAAHANHRNAHVDLGDNPVAKGLVV